MICVIWTNRGMIAAEGKMEQIVINEKISYIECSENPLSADIGIIREGDTLYSKARDGYYVFNAQLVKEEIAVLKGLKAPYLLVSHYKGLIRPRDAVIAELEELYRSWDKNGAEIRAK